MKPEAASLLEGELSSFGSRPWDALKTLVGKPPTIRTVIGEAGVTYQVELEVFWDDRPDGTIRVQGSIEDEGPRPLQPLSRNLLVPRTDSRADA